MGVVVGLVVSGHGGGLLYIESSIADHSRRPLSVSSAPAGDRDGHERTPEQERDDEQPDEERPPRDKSVLPGASGLFSTGLANMFVTKRRRARPLHDDLLNVGRFLGRCHAGEHAHCLHCGQAYAAASVSTVSFPQVPAKRGPRRLLLEAPSAPPLPCRRPAQGGPQRWHRHHNLAIVARPESTPPQGFVHDGEITLTGRVLPIGGLLYVHSYMPMQTLILRTNELQMNCAAKE